MNWKCFGRIALGLPLLLQLGCDANLLPDPESRAAALPLEADVAVGATHDILVAACQDRVTLFDVVLPAAVTTLFVGLGRLDAIFYLPEAQVAALVPDCDPVEYRVTAAGVDSAALELEETANPNAFKGHAREAGTATFSATVNVNGDVVEVQSTLRTHLPNRVEFAPRCDSALEGEEVLAGWVPSGRAVGFTHGLYRDQLPLSGYGLSGIDSPLVTPSEHGSGGATVQLPEASGDVTFTSRFDPGFSLTVHAFDVGAFDSLELTRPSAGDLFVGQTLSLSSQLTIGGKVPCVWGFSRTITVETPDACRIDQHFSDTTLTQVRNAPFTLQGTAPGTCRVRVELPGSSLSDVVELQVYPTFVPLPFELELPFAVGLHDVLVTPGETLLVGWEDDVSGFLEGVIVERTPGERERLVKPQGVKTLWAIHGSADGSVFIAGGNGKVVRRTGTTWEVMDTGVTARLWDVWVFSATDVYVAGEEGTLLHFDGSSWTRIETGVTSRLTSLWGASPGDLWVLGWGQVMLRYRNGALENALPENAPASFDAPNAIAGTSLDNLWVLDNNTVLRSSAGGGGWTQVPLTLQPGEILGKIWAMPDGTAYALMSRPGSRSEWFAIWLGGSREVRFPVSGAGAVTGLGQDVYVLSAKELSLYRHDPSLFP